LTTTSLSYAPSCGDKASGRITYRFHARDLHLVMGPAAPGSSVKFRVLIDGQPPGAAHGVDVDEQGNGTVTEQRFYQLIRQPNPIADRHFEIEFFGPGVEPSLIFSARAPYPHRSAARLVPLVAQSAQTGHGSLQKAYE
jgi:hypothetical protein